MTSATSATPASSASSTWNEPPGVAPRGTVLLLPGRGEQPALYRRFGARIAADGYRVRVLPDPTIGIEHVFAQLAAALADPETVAPRVLAGVDTGALAAARAAADGLSPLDALILVGLPDPQQNTDGLLESWDDEVEYRASCPTHRGLIADESLVERGALRTGRVPAVLREPIDYATLAVPVLGLHGDDDVLSPFDGVRASYALVPQAQVVLVGHGRHDVLNAAAHRSVAARVVQFLEALRAGDPTRPILQEVKP